MSFRCEACFDDAKFECTCVNRVHMCSQHVEAHAKGCSGRPQFIGNDLINQADRVSEAISHLKELRAKVWENSQNLIEIIHQTSRILMSSIESMQKMLDEIQFGTAWDHAKIESIKELKLEDISLENFKSTIKEIVHFTEALPNNAPVAVIPVLAPNKLVRPPVVPPKTLEQKIQEARTIGVDSSILKRNIQEICFTRDGNYVFICNLYVDCKFYQGIRYAGCRSYAGSRSYAACRSYADGRSYAGSRSYADCKYY